MVTKRGQVYVCILDDRRVKRLSGLGYKLECIVCHIPFNRGETIVHKGRRLYHPKCWELVWYDIPDDILDENDLHFIEYGEYSNITSSSTISPIPSSTIDLSD
jgi:hypothetical protein